MKGIDQDIIERVTQLWCLPQHAEKIMDHDLCTSICRLVQDVRQKEQEIGLSGLKIAIVFFLGMTTGVAFIILLRLVS